MTLLISELGIILISIAVFLVILLTLVIILLFARSKLIPQGEVKLQVNDKELEVPPGVTLLSTLSNQGIFLPSACGGGGTCAMCKCQVIEGGGSILPTETGFFTRKEQQDNWRLACQVKVRNDMVIKVPEEVMGIKKWECEVISNRNVATFIKEFKVKLPEGETLGFKSGGYVQIDVPKVEVFRAYSMANHPAEGNIVMLNIRIATPPWDRAKGQFMKVNPGVCSSYIFSKKPGDTVTISGPYGDFFIKETEREMVYIGGGAGMAPLRSHIFHLFHTLKTNRKVTFWYGGRSKREIFYEEDFREIEKLFPNFKFNIALSEPKKEDNWNGYTGFIHQVVYDEYLSKHEEPEEIEFYLCGPPMMNDAVMKMLYDLGVPNEMVDFDDFGS